MKKACASFFLLLCLLLCLSGCKEKQKAEKDEFFNPSYQNLLQSSEDQVLYNAYVKALSDVSSGTLNYYRTGIDLSANRKHYWKIFLFALYDHPEYSSCVGKKTSIKFKENSLFRIYDQKKYEKAKIPPNCNDPDSIYDWLTSNVTYDNESCHCNDIYGALNEKRANCSGISFAFKYLLDQSEVPNCVVTGYTKEGEYHMWNMVWQDGSWVFYDATFGRKNPKAFRAMTKEERDQTIQSITMYPKE